MYKTIISIGLIIMLLACNLHTKDKNDAIQKGDVTLIRRDLLIGTWLRPLPGNEAEKEGFILLNDGTAESVNMATLLYQSWKIEGDKIKFRIRSIGNQISLTEDCKHNIKEVTD